MDQPLPDAISLGDFLTLESQQSERYEWIDGTVVQFAGVTDEHAAVSAKLTAIIRPSESGRWRTLLRAWFRP